MRRAFIVVLGFGLAIVWNVGVSRAFQEKKPRVLVVKGETLQTGPEGFRLTGSVSFALPDGTVVTADDAIVSATTAGIELLGTVRMKVPDGVKLMAMSTRDCCPR